MSQSSFAVTEHLRNIFSILIEQQLLTGVLIALNPTAKLNGPLKYRAARVDSY